MLFKMRSDTSRGFWVSCWVSCTAPAYESCDLLMIEIQLVQQTQRTDNKTK